MERIFNIVWILLGGLIAAMTIILMACLLIEPKSQSQEQVIKTVVPITLDIFKYIVGAVVGAAGAAYGKRITAE